MPKGQFGARHLQKHLWKLPIPEFDADNPLHVEISNAGRAAATGAAHRYAQLRQERDPNPSVTITRRELRGLAADVAGGRGGGDGRGAPAGVGGDIILMLKYRYTCCLMLRVREEGSNGKRNTVL